ncbi:hypothetical protein KR032_001625, partial [Drosophila birchii]
AHRDTSINTDDLEDYKPGSLRPVSFVFYTLETILNMYCLGFHISGFQGIKLVLFGVEAQLIHYLYLIIFYIFMVITLFQSVNVCTGHNPTITRELVKSTLATVAFFFVSLSTMWDAERQFYKFIEEPHKKEGTGKFTGFEPVQPVFIYMRSQSICALACGILYLLHTCILFDFHLTTRNSNGEYMPMALFVFGKWVHTKLEKYEWFREFASDEAIKV